MDRDKEFYNLCMFCKELLITVYMIYDMKLCEKCRSDFKKYYKKYRSASLYYWDSNFNTIRENYINKYVNKIKNWNNQKSIYN